jgi:hypothetical protein
LHQNAENAPSSDSDKKTTSGSQALFLNTRPVVAGAGFAAAAFLVAVAPATPLLIVPMTVFFVAVPLVDAVFGTAPRAVAGFLTTVEVLPSLDSLTPLARRAVRVAALLDDEAAAVVAPFFVLAAVDLAVPDVLEPLDELAVDAFVAFRTVAAARVDRAFSTMLLSRFVALTVFVGDTGRAMKDFPGDAAARSRGITLVLDDVGERI